jgi:hypothetical protein
MITSWLTGPGGLAVASLAAAKAAETGGKVRGGRGAGRRVGRLALAVRALTALLLPVLSLTAPGLAVLGLAAPRLAALSLAAPRRLAVLSLAAPGRAALGRVAALAAEGLQAPGEAVGATGPARVPGRPAQAGWRHQAGGPTGQARHATEASPAEAGGTAAGGGRATRRGGGSAAG